MADLIVQSGKLKGKRLVLPAKEMIVGRDDDCDLRIASSLVSRKHCVLKPLPEGILVTDLASQNGTHINDVPISEPTLLREGDTLRIGATVLAVPYSQKPKLTPEESQPLISDADIADWHANASGADTTVIESYPAPESTPIPATNSPTPLPKSSAGSKVQFSKPLSVKDEAALIIQKHWETVKAKQNH